MDTGPLVALFDRSDSHHKICKKTFSLVSEPLITTWPVLTEAFYMLSTSSKAQELLMHYVLSGALEIYAESTILPRMGQLMKKYDDIPMDFADASLVALAEEILTDKIFTLDHKDFRIYKPRHSKSFLILPENLVPHHE